MRYFQYIHNIESGLTGSESWVTMLKNVEPGTNQLR